MARQSGAEGVRPFDMTILRPFDMTILDWYGVRSCSEGLPPGFNQGFSDLNQPTKEGTNPVAILFFLLITRANSEGVPTDTDKKKMNKNKNSS